MTDTHFASGGIVRPHAGPDSTPTPSTGPIVADWVPRFGITRSRNGQWSCHVVAANGEITWTTETFTTLGTAEDALFLIVDEVDAILAEDVDGDPIAPQAIPYTLTMGSGKSKTVETRIAHR